MFTGYDHSSEEMDQREKEIMQWIEQRKQDVLFSVHYIITFCGLST